MDYLYILDEMIKVFKDTEPRQRAFNVVQLQNELLKNNPSLSKGWSKDLTDEVIAKLIKDEFVREDKQAFNNRDLLPEQTKYYMITIEGLIFKDHGGYRYKIKRQNTSTNLQSVQTWSIAIGTALAGIYSLYELWKHVFSPCN